MLNDENWRIAVLSVHIWVSLNPGEFRLFPTFSVSLVLREPFENEFGSVVVTSPKLTLMATLISCRSYIIRL